MYRQVITISDDGTIWLEGITDIGNLLQKKKYKSIDELPPPVSEKLKQLLWVSEHDQSYLDGVGTRIGKNLFWVC